MHAYVTIYLLSLTLSWSKQKRNGTLVKPFGDAKNDEDDAFEDDDNDGNDEVHVSGLPAKIQAQAQDLRCNPHPAKDKNELKTTYLILKGIISQRLCDRAVEIIRENHAVEIIRENHHLFTIDI